LIEKVFIVLTLYGCGFGANSVRPGTSVGIVSGGLYLALNIDGIFPAVSDLKVVALVLVQTQFRHRLVVFDGKFSFHDKVPSGAEFPPDGIGDVVGFHLDGHGCLLALGFRVATVGGDALEGVADGGFDPSTGSRAGSGIHAGGFGSGAAVSTKKFNIVYMVPFIGRKERGKNEHE